MKEGFSYTGPEREEEEVDKGHCVDHIGESENPFDPETDDEFEVE